MFLGYVRQMSIKIIIIIIITILRRGDHNKKISRPWYPNATRRESLLNRLSCPLDDPVGQGAELNRNYSTAGTLNRKAGKGKRLDNSWLSGCPGECNDNLSGMLGIQ